MEALLQHKCNICIVIETLTPKCFIDIFCIPCAPVCVMQAVLQYLTLTHKLTWNQFYTFCCQLTLT